MAEDWKFVWSATICHYLMADMAKKRRSAIILPRFVAEAWENIWSAMKQGVIVADNGKAYPAKIVRHLVDDTEKSMGPATICHYFLADMAKKHRPAIILPRFMAEAWKDVWSATKKRQKMADIHEYLIFSADYF